MTSELPRSNVEDLSCYWNGGSVELPPDSGNYVCSKAACPVSNTNNSGCLALPRSALFLSEEAPRIAASDGSCYRQGGRRWIDRRNENVCPIFGCNTSDSNPNANCREGNSLTEAGPIPDVCCPLGTAAMGACMQGELVAAEAVV